MPGVSERKQKQAQASCLHLRELGAICAGETRVRGVWMAMSSSVIAGLRASHIGLDRAGLRVTQANEASDAYGVVPC